MEEIPWQGVAHPRRKGEGDTTEVMRSGPALRSEGAGKRRALELEINEARL